MLSHVRDDSSKSCYLVNNVSTGNNCAMLADTSAYSDLRHALYKRIHLIMFFDQFRSNGSLRENPSDWVRSKENLLNTLYTGHIFTQSS